MPNSKQVNLSQTAVYLSQNRTILLDEYQTITRTEADQLISALGESAVEFLNNHQIALCLCTDINRRPSKNTNVSSENSLEKSGLMPINYFRTEYCFVYKERYVILSVFTKIPKPKNFHKPNIVVQFDFMFLDDYLNSIESSVAFHRTSKLKYISPKTFDLTGIKFLISMRDLIESISKTTQINVCYGDKQRDKIYHKALGHLPNVKFENIGSIFSQLFS